MSNLIKSQSEGKHVGHSNLHNDVVGTSSERSLNQDLRSKWQKWRSWWSRKTQNVPIASPESSDSDVESVSEEGISIFMKARCHMMRMVGKLDDVFTGIQHVHTERYGPSEVEDTSSQIRLRMRHRAPGLETQRWELMLLINSVDLMHRKVQAIRNISISYKSEMDKRMYGRISEDNGCLTETRIEKMDSDNDLDSSTKDQMEEKKADKNMFVRGFAYILAILCSAFYFIVGKSTKKTSEEASPNQAPSTSEDLTSRLVEAAFNRKGNGKGLEDSAPSASWMLLTVTSYPRNGIVQRCVNLETVLRRDRSTTDQVKRTTGKTQGSPTISTMQKGYLQAIDYLGEVSCCVYIARLLTNIDAALFEVQKGLDAINDRPLKCSRPYSDRAGLLRQVLTRGEVNLELKQIANISASRRELLSKEGLTKIVRRLEAKVEGIHRRYDGWRRAREMPGRRHKTGGKPSVKKAVRLETEMCFRQTSAGLVVRRICVFRKQSLVERAFGGHTVKGLNVVTSLHLGS